VPGGGPAEGQPLLHPDLSTGEPFGADAQGRPFGVGASFTLLGGLKGGRRAVGVQVLPPIAGSGAASGASVRHAIDGSRSVNRSQLLLAGLDVRCQFGECGLV
jgi:hypothetical protein